MTSRLPLHGISVCWTCRQALRKAGPISRSLSSSARRPAQSKEIDDFYALLLADPLPTSARVTRKATAATPTPSKTEPSSPSSTPPMDSSSPSPSSSSSKPPNTDTQARAKIIFGSRLAGPVERAQRAREREAQATTIGGVRVPPRPGEPDNCCMSGCVNCVWDLYREELEEWAAKRREAEMALHGNHDISTNGGGGDDVGLRAQQQVTGGAMGQAALSMDDDGGGSDTNWDAEDALLPSSGSSLFASVPVGIREFMRTEKRLGQKRREREAAQ